MKLVHFTASPLRFGYPAGVKRMIPRVDGAKPRGFWVSDEDDFGWLEWCKAERFRLDCLKHAYEVKLIDEPNILFLRSVEDIDLFTQTYGLVHDWQRTATHVFNTEGRRHIYSIDWLRPQPLFNGIIITPYQWARRLDGGATWYNTWDCASGVIWNTDAIASVTEIEPPDLTEALAEKAKEDAERDARHAENGWHSTMDAMRAMTQRLREATEQMQKEREASE